METVSRLPVSKVISTFVQSLVPVTALVLYSVPWTLSSAPRPPRTLRTLSVLIQALRRYLLRGSTFASMYQLVSEPVSDLSTTEFFPVRPTLVESSCVACPL